MRFLASFQKDLALAFRSLYAYIEILMAVLIVIVLVFIVPEDAPRQTPIFVHLGVEGALREKLLEVLEEESAAGATKLTLSDRPEDVRAGLEADRSAVGLLVSLEDGKVRYEFVLQGYESDQVRNTLQTGFLSEMVRSVPGFVDETRVTVLDRIVEKLPTRLDLLPLLLVMNSAFVGLFIISAYIFMDKEEGSIKAFAVTPARIWEYLLSKVAMMLGMGLVTGLFTVLAVTGFRVHILLFLPLLVACNLFGSALGLLIASFFDTMTKSLGALYVAIIALGLTAVSYFMPSFSPFWITLLPTYPMLFAMRETLLAKPDSAYVLAWSGVFLVLSVGLFLLSDLRYRRTLTV